jgi:hypothetical protein
MNEQVTQITTADRVLALIAAAGERASTKMFP